MGARDGALRSTHEPLEGETRRMRESNLRPGALPFRTVDVLDGEMFPRRLSSQPDSSPPLAVLLHGYGGDERSMGVFAGALPRGWEALAVRGILPAEPGGYCWHDGARWPPPEARRFAPAVEFLHGRVGERPAVWIGFSQGAALAFCCAAAGLPTIGVASLAGYLPAGLPALPHGLPVFWSHGTKDRRVPIGSARRAADELRARGADLEFCESDTGHKVGAACLRALRAWLVRLAAT